MLKRIMLTILLACAATGCSAFDKAWKAAPAQAAAAGDVTGRWTGTWKSEATGHTDQLQAVLVKVDDQHYQAYFHAHYMTVVTFNSEVLFTAAPTPDGAGRRFTGEKDLGQLAGGVYHYNGLVTPDAFHLDYKADSDHGTFDLSRP